ncbi:MAG: putative photosynthetic complex assembly protein PuhE [Pseudomonadota bacterium]
MTTIWIAIFAACFIWWFSTGAILYVVQVADRGGDFAHLNVTIATAPFLLIAIYGSVSANQVLDILSVYLAFMSAIIIWGWFELAFLCGVITGPKPEPCPPTATGFERFLRGWGAVAYSEMCLLSIAVLLIFVTQDAPNKFGMWTFMILLLARVSAKLNLYMGVPHINTEFLPRPVRHLASHFKTAKMNWLFPVSITALAGTLALWVERVPNAATEAAQVGYTLLATLTALALFEHWMMVLRVPDAKLWQWMLPNNKATGHQND